MSDVYSVYGITFDPKSREYGAHNGLYVATSDSEAIGLHTQFLSSKSLSAATIFASPITQMAKRLLAETGKAYPTEDAYMAACRANHWHVAQLRAHGIEPLDLSKVEDLTHYPPDDFDFLEQEKK